MEQSQKMVEVLLQQQSIQELSYFLAKAQVFP